ncbi:hypothetical protein [Roseovarius sp.]|nr:hypothetical protein [Roseovarius sp.]
MRMLRHILCNPQYFKTSGRTIDHHLVHARIKGAIKMIINPIKMNGS